MIRRLLLLILLACVLPRWALAIDIQPVKTPGGIEFWLVEDHVNPIISLALGFRGGSAYDPPGKEGLANLVSGLLDEGAGDLDSTAFQTQLEDLGVELRFSAGLDDFQGKMRFLSDDSERALSLLKLALTAPRFDDEPVERIRDSVLIDIEESATKPGDLASRVMQRLMLKDHPYARPSEGTYETVMSLTKADLSDFVRSRFVKSRLFLAVVGDVDPAEAAKLIDETFGSLPEDSELPPLRPIEANAEGGFEHIHMDKLPQAVVQFVQPGIPRNDPRFFAAYLNNYVLGGGGFSSRLMQEVREKRGLAYGIGTDLWTFDAGGLIGGQVQTSPDNAMHAIGIIKAEWQKLRDHGPTAEELQNAKDYLIGYYPRNFTTSTDIAQTLLQLQIENLGIDYVNRRQKEIAAVTLEDARAMARELFDPESLSFVVVGPGSITETIP